MSDIEVFIPGRPDGEALSDALRALTAEIEKRRPGLEAGYGLGGPSGYGVDIDTPVFAMRRFYWGDCDCGFEQRETEWSDNHKHADECYQVKVRDALVAAGGVRSEWDYIQRPDHLSFERWDEIEDGIRKTWCEHFALTFPDGCAVHCTCNYVPAWQAWIKDNGHAETCALELPNFLYKPTGFEVRWYKWIGRDNELKGEPPDLAAMVAACVASVEPLPTPQ